MLHTIYHLFPPRLSIRHYTPHNPLFYVDKPRFLALEYNHEVLANFPLKHMKRPPLCGAASSRSWSDLDLFALPVHDFKGVHDRPEHPVAASVRHRDD